MNDDNTVEQILTRLRRIEGQIRGLQRMFEQGRECEDVLTQLTAVRSGLEQVGLLIMDVHLRRCVLGDEAADGEKLATLRDALRLWTRLGLTVPDRSDTFPATDA